MITAVIITKNEERNIGRCLDSLVPVVDEVLVLDSFSTDATADICARHGVRFVTHEWEGYVATKNYANGLASNDWILSVDADEALQKATEKFIFRFSAMENAILCAGKRFQDLTLSEMDVYWERSKHSAQN